MSSVSTMPGAARPSDVTSRKLGDVMKSRRATPGRTPARKPRHWHQRRLHATCTCTCPTERSQGRASARALTTALSRRSPAARQAGPAMTARSPSPARAAIAASREGAGRLARGITSSRCRHNRRLETARRRPPAHRTRFDWASCWAGPARREFSRRQLFSRPRWRRHRASQRAALVWPLGRDRHERFNEVAGSGVIAGVLTVASRNC